MFSIFKRVKKVFDSEYFHKSAEFKEGFRVCFQLFEIGYQRINRYNADVQLQKALKDLKAAQEELARQKEKISELYSLRQSLNEARNAIRYQDALIKEWNVNNIAKLTPKFAKRMTIIKMASVINSPEPSDKRMEELRFIFMHWNIRIPDLVKKAG